MSETDKFKYANTITIPITEYEAMKQDKARLDWFEREKPCVHHVYDGGGFSFGLDVSNDTDENIFHSPIIREAIDAAIISTGESKNEKTSL